MIKLVFLVFSFIWLLAAPTLADYASEVAADSPLVHLRMGETTGAGAFDDATANNRDFTTRDFTGVQAGGLLVGDSGTIGAQLFDGSNDYADDGDEAAYSPSTTGQFTIEAWLSWTADNGSYTFPDIPWIAGKATTSNYEWGLSIAAHSTNQLFVIFSQSGGANHCTASGGAIVPGTTYHVVATYESAVICEVFIDGISVGSSTSFTGSMADGTAAPRIAHRAVDGAGAFCNCTLDEFALYSTRLSSTRIAAHHTAGTVAGVAQRPRIITSKRPALLDWFLVPEAHAADAWGVGDY